MKKNLAGGAVWFLLIVGHAHAGEIKCPAITDIHKDIESVEDVFFVDAQDGHEWESESVVDVVDTASLQFEGAEYVINKDDESQQTAPRTTITCRYGAINLSLEYEQVFEPAFSKWMSNSCESADVRMCRLMDGDYFNLIY
jgi:hypothetical protein